MKKSRRHNKSALSGGEVPSCVSGFSGSRPNLAPPQGSGQQGRLKTLIIIENERHTEIPEGQVPIYLWHSVKVKQVTIYSSFSLPSFSLNPFIEDYYITSKIHGTILVSLLSLRNLTFRRSCLFSTLARVL